MSRIEISEPCQSLIQRDQIGFVFAPDIDPVVQSYSKTITTTLLTISPASRIDQNTPHQLSRYGKEMSSALPVDLIRINQAEKGLIHQCTRLKRVARVLTSHEIAGDSAQLTINGRYQLIQRRFITFSPSDQQLRDLRGVRGLFRHKNTYVGKVNFPLILPYAALAEEVFAFRSVLKFERIASYKMSRKRTRTNNGRFTWNAIIFFGRPLVSQTQNK
jgi:hypothetical protein